MENDGRDNYATTSLSKPERQIIRSAGVVGANTLLSRILGYIRDRVVAYLLGTSVMADVFYAVFRLPNTFRRLMGEGALTAAVIPVFTEVHQKEGSEEGWALANRLFFAVSVILIIITALGVIFSAEILSVTGFAKFYGAENFKEAVVLNRIIFPYIFFICLAALAMALLNSVGVFGVPSFTPVLLNLSVIFFALVFGRGSDAPVRALAWGVIFGGILQLGIQVPSLVRRGMTFFPRRPIISARVLQSAWLFVPAAFGAGITQINILVGTLVATYLDPGSVSSLYYADRVMELMYGVYALGIATVILPTLSRLTAAGAEEEVRRMITFALRLIFFLMVPSSLGLIMLRQPIAEVLFRGGKFDAQSVSLTATALLFYSIGLVGYSALRIVVAVFYARKDTKTPVRVAFVAFATNLILMSYLIHPLGHGGIALANAVSIYINCGLLFLVYYRRSGGLSLSPLINSLARIATASAVMGLAVFAFSRFVGLDGAEMPLANKTFYLFACIAVGVGTYFGSAAILRCGELKDISLIFRRKLPDEKMKQSQNMVK